LTPGCLRLAMMFKSRKRTTLCLIELRADCFHRGHMVRKIVALLGIRVAKQQGGDRYDRPGLNGRQL
jgi:hypothetical protein